MSVYDDGEHVYIPPPPIHPPVTYSNKPVTFLEWLTLGKLSVILGTLAFVVIAVVSALYGAPQ